MKRGKFMILTGYCKSTCLSVHKKSKAFAFSSVKVGDKMEFSVELRRAGNHGSGTMATYIKCFNPQTNETNELSFNQLGNVLRAFEFDNLTCTCAAVCKDVLKKTKTFAFNSVKIGDKMEFSVKIAYAGTNGSSRGTMATYIKCFNPQTNETNELSFNQLGNVLNCFEFEEIT